MGRVQMKNQNESHAAVRGHLGEELLERSQSARGSADADDERAFALNRRSRDSMPRRCPGFFLSRPCGRFFLLGHRHHIGSVCV